MSVDETVELKTCPACKQAKRPDRLYAYCRTCNRDKTKQWAEQNPEKDKIRRRTFKLRDKYGLTPLQVEAMRVAQNNCCAICSASFEIVRACVDHCHVTGKVRALLCMQCNTGLGAFHDRPDLLDRANRYVKFHKEN